jgi:hypothetical protein
MSLPFSAELCINFMMQHWDFYLRRAEYFAEQQSDPEIVAHVL